MLGKAADIAVVGFTKADRGADKATKFYTLWRAVLANPPEDADRFQLEPTALNPFIFADKVNGTWVVGYGGLEETILEDTDLDGVPDTFDESDHLHIQDNP